jgi:hypothetical protein
LLLRSGPFFLAFELKAQVQFVLFLLKKNKKQNKNKNSDFFLKIRTKANAKEEGNLLLNNRPPL